MLGEKFKTTPLKIYGWLVILVIVHWIELFSLIIWFFRINNGEFSEDDNFNLGNHSFFHHSLFTVSVRLMSSH